MDNVSTSRMSSPKTIPNGGWTAADFHFLAACGLVLLFTAQRLTGYMTVYLYQHLAYERLIYAAHFFGGAGLVAACTMGSTPAKFQLRSVPFIRVVVNVGWLVGGLLVLVLWWMCTPAWRPESDIGQMAAMMFVIVTVLVIVRPIDNAISNSGRARLWKLAVPTILWQAYSLDWELRLNFLKDETALTRADVQWPHVAIDLFATTAGLAWTLYVARTSASRK
jgi:hypothetical protein